MKPTPFKRVSFVILFVVIILHFHGHVNRFCFENGTFPTLVDRQSRLRYNAHEQGGTTYMATFYERLRQIMDEKDMGVQAVFICRHSGEDRLPFVPVNLFLSFLLP